MTLGKLCLDCRTLVDQSVANDPHGSLQMRSAMILAPSDSHYYECRTCGAKLLRAQQRGDPSIGWRLG